MNETLRVIKNRRSIRAYKPDQISDSELREILDAALLAPSAINLQKRHFTVIQSREVIDWMVGIITGIMKSSGNQRMIDRATDPNYHTFYHAPTVIIISGDAASPYTPNDCSAAAENILIAAESLNIGSCWIGSVLTLFSTDKAPEYQRKLGIPEGYRPVCGITLGYKGAGDPETPPRNKDVINYIK